QFTIIGFFENDYGIRLSLNHAWSPFKKHFGVLATLGLILSIIGIVYLAFSGILTVLIQSGFNIISVSNLNLLNPSTSLSKNLLFILISGACRTVFLPLNSSTFVSAYLKYSDAKLPFQMRVSDKKF
ncbi:MAG TPA: hypothetical protein VMT73_09005, partial [Anaerolineales bacterium]|nr:hypothetical protein [Anaerolineales bacterium]